MNLNLNNLEAIHAINNLAEEDTLTKEEREEGGEEREGEEGGEDNIKVSIEEQTSLNSIADIKNVFYINLNTRVDRRQHVEKELTKIRLFAQRYNAFPHKVGAIGCTISHLSLLKMAKEQKLDHILILEDDITFLNPEIFVDSLNKFLSNHQDFDVLLIAGNNMGEYDKIDENCVQVHYCKTSTGYLVKSHYYDTLIQNYEESLKNLIKYSNIPKLVAHFSLDSYWFNLQILDAWFLLTPLTIVQKQDYSNIENRVVNYNKLMLNLDKEKLMAPPQQQSQQFQQFQSRPY